METLTEMWATVTVMPGTATKFSIKLFPGPETSSRCPHFMFLKPAPPTGESALGFSVSLEAAVTLLPMESSSPTEPGHILLFPSQRSTLSLGLPLSVLHFRVFSVHCILA